MRIRAEIASAAVLWSCIALFFARVLGQVEVLLLEPAALPPMSAWYSGLLPYPLLLPLQIALLMLMCALVIRRQTLGSGTGAARPGKVNVWRVLAIVYFAVMMARLIWCIHQYAGDFYLHGAIPIAFHWVLALFTLTLARESLKHFPRAPAVESPRESPAPSPSRNRADIRSPARFP